MAKPFPMWQRWMLAIIGFVLLSPVVLFLIGYLLEPLTR